MPQSPRTQAPVDVVLTWSGQDGATFAHLTVLHADGGALLANVDLTAEEFTGLMASSLINTTAEVDMTNGARVTVPAQVTLTYPTSNRRDGRYAEVEIVDSASGMLMAEVDLPAEALASLMAARTVRATAAVEPDAVRARIGYTHERGAIDVPADLVQGHYGRDVTPAMTEFAAAAAREGRWETTTWDRSQRGWTLTGHRWA